MPTSPRVFVTGVSGYIGGHVVANIIEKHPEWHLAVLVRNEEQRSLVLRRWPQVEIVLGDLDNKSLMIEEASKSDVVLQTASADHIPGVLALIQGASQRKSKPAYFIHVGGSGILHDVSNDFGNPSDKTYSDITDVAEITSFPLQDHVHRDVDAAILEAQKRLGVPTAIVSPPTIHGIGKGPIKTRSIQVPFLIDAILKRGRGFQVLGGQNSWDQTHIDDIATAFILLVEEGLKPMGGKAQWGDNGYYFAEAGDFKWGDISALITKVLFDQGLVKSAEVDKLSVEEAQIQHPWAPLLWGGNSRGQADRLRRLGWKVAGPDIFASLPVMVAEEVRNFGTQSSLLTLDK